MMRIEGWSDMIVGSPGCRWKACKIVTNMKQTNKQISFYKISKMHPCVRTSELQSVSMFKTEKETILY